MANERSSHLNEVVEAIALLKNVEKEWPGGYLNPVLKETLKKTERQLQEELFLIMSQKKEKRSGMRKKGTYQKE